MFASKSQLSEVFWSPTQQSVWCLGKVYNFATFILKFVTFICNYFKQSLLLNDLPAEILN